MCPEEGYCRVEEGQGPWGVCVLHACGDGVVGGDEACDDGNLNEGDGCDSTCHFEPIEVRSSGMFTAGPLAAQMAAVYDLVLTRRSRVTITVSQDGAPCPAAFDTELWVRNKNTQGLVAHNDNISEADFCSAASFDVAGAGSYRAEIWGKDQAPLEGTFTVHIHIQDILLYGAQCDRSERTNVCGPGLLCRVTRGEGVGMCSAPEDVNFDDPLGPTAACDAFEEQARCAEGYACVDENNDRDGACMLSQPLQLGLNSGSINTLGERNAFTLSLERAARIDLETFVGGEGQCAQGANTMLRIYRREGLDLTLIGTFDDDGVGLCSRAQPLLVAGDYVIIVHEISDTRLIPEYTLRYALEPAQVNGEPCDRLEIQNFCEPNHVCVPTEGHGVGECRRRVGFDFDEVEPNNTPGSAQVAHTDTRFYSSISPAGDVDFFALHLEAPTYIHVNVQDLERGCRSRTQLYRVERTLFESYGPSDYGMSPPWMLAYHTNDPSIEGQCSQLYDTLAPGTHYFLVKSYARTGAGILSIERYTFTINFPPPEVPVGAVCDPKGIHTRCAAGSHCVDAQGIGDGRCQL